MPQNLARDIGKLVHFQTTGFGGCVAGMTVPNVLPLKTTNLQTSWHACKMVQQKDKE